MGQCTVRPGQATRANHLEPSDRSRFALNQRIACNKESTSYRGSGRDHRPYALPTKKREKTRTHGNPHVLHSARRRYRLRQNRLSDTMEHPRHGSLITCQHVLPKPGVSTRTTPLRARMRDVHAKGRYCIAVCMYACTYHHPHIGT